MEIIKRDNYECQKCKEKVKYSKADCVHHIIHLKDNPYLALESSNLISLCNECHNLEHPEKLNKMIKMNKKEPITTEIWQFINTPGSKKWLFCFSADRIGDQENILF